jgi:hypothetical protein
MVCADISVLREPPTGAFRFQVGAGPEAVARALEQALGSRAARAKRAVVRRYSWGAVLHMIERAVTTAVG